MCESTPYSGGRVKQEEYFPSLSRWAENALKDEKYFTSNQFLDDARDWLNKLYKVDYRDKNRGGGHERQVFNALRDIVEQGITDKTRFLPGKFNTWDGQIRSLLKSLSEHAFKAAYIHDNPNASSGRSEYENI